MRKGIILFLISILFLSSCGIPSYRNYSDYISVSNRVSNVNGYDIEYDAGFLVYINRSADPNLLALQPGSPSVLLLYTIAPDHGSLAENFNRYIRNYNNYYNGSPVTFDTGRLDNVESNSDGNPIYLYPFRGDDGRPFTQPVEYTFGDLNSSDKVYEYYYFMIRRSERDGINNFHFIMDVYGSDSLSDNPYPIEEGINLFRYTGENTLFTATTEGHSSSNDYSYYYVREEDDSSDYIINIALAVNIVPNASSPYSNIYWSQLVFNEVKIQ